MRELKFRFYTGKIIREPEYFTSKDLIEEENWKVMQYTGLKDKNGKEIYEGDIVKRDYIKNGVVEYFVDLGFDGGGASHAGFYCKEWLDDMYEEHSELDYCYSFDDCEVIGNIYENPELLTN